MSLKNKVKNLREQPQCVEDFDTLGGYPTTIHRWVFESKIDQILGAGKHVNYKHVKPSEFEDTLARIKLFK